MSQAVLASLLILNKLRGKGEMVEFVRHGNKVLTTILVECHCHLQRTLVFSICPAGFTCSLNTGGYSLSFPHVINGALMPVVLNFFFAFLVFLLTHVPQILII